MKTKIVYVDNFLTQYGHTPTIGASISSLLLKEGYEVVATSTKQAKLPRLLDMLGTIFRNRKNAIVLISTYSTEAFYFALICSQFCSLLNIKYVPFLHGGNLPERINSSKKMSQLLFGKSYMNVAVSGYLEAVMIKNKWPVTVIPNPIHIEQYPFLQRLKCTPKILWVRSFHEIYNPTLAVKILCDLLKVEPDAFLTMVGPDKDGSLEICKQLATELNVLHRIEFAGLLSRDQWIKLSSSHDIFINTTNFDNLPVSIIEAMALGLPIISTNVGGIKFLIEDTVNGLLVNPNNVQEFVIAIKTLMVNNTLVTNLSAHARTFAEKYDWSCVKQQWNALLQDA